MRGAGGIYRKKCVPRGIKRTDITIDGNVKWLLLLGCTIVGIILIVIGIIREYRRFNQLNK